MAKINPLFGKFQGKLGGTVFAIRNGVQVMREYNPSPLNPNTQSQIQARAKLKLMSQLSTVMAPVIAIRRQGSVSSRNMFVKTNYPLASYADNTASVELMGVQLTKSVVALPGVIATRSGSSVNVELSAPTNVDRVVYVYFAKQSDNTLRLLGSNVVSEAGAGGTFATTASIGNANAVMYAYGVRDNTEAARVTFGNMQVISAETVAKIITSRVLVESDVTLTETKAVEIAVSRDGGNDKGDGNDDDKSEMRTSKKK